MSEPAIVRCSSLPMYADCSRRVAARIWRREIRDAGYELRELPGGIGAKVGSATHAGAAAMLQAKMETGEPLDVKDSVDVAVYEFQGSIADGVVWDSTSPSRNDAEKQIARMTRMYHATVAQEVEVASVEQRLNAQVSEKLVLSGQSDLVTTIRAWLRDLKTGRAQRANGPQYGGYTRLLRSHGITVVKIVEDYLPRAPLSKTQPEPVATEYDVELCERMTEMILRQIERDIVEFRRTGSPDAFVPNPNSQLCSDRYCEAHGTDFCPFGKRSRP